MTFDRVPSITADHLEVVQVAPSFDLGKLYSEITLWRLAIDELILLTLLISVTAKIVVQPLDQRLNIVRVAECVTDIKVIKGRVDEA